MPAIDLETLRRIFAEHGVRRLFAKRMAENDNSKNQIYLAGSFEVLNLVPFGPLKVHKSEAGRLVMQAPLTLAWLTGGLGEAPAPAAKLILYPQYPEVRLSGFLRGCAEGPTGLLSADVRVRGRVLLLGIRSDRTILAHVVGPSDPLAREVDSGGYFDAGALLAEIPLEPRSGRSMLLQRLAEIAAEGWIPSVRLDNSGALHPCHAMNCGGLTLEAKLGIASNSKAEPDFHGWEVKQYAATNFTKCTAKSPVTLFTPEPTIGVYASEGVVPFIRRFGYPDTKGRGDRLNVGGRFTVGRRNARTRLILLLDGYDALSGHLVDPTGGLHLRGPNDVLAAGWPFATLIEHWNRKHAQAAYVPSLREDDPRRYRFSSTVFLGVGSDFGRFLAGLSAGRVYYDPGIKLEGESTDRSKAHRRSQFRISFGHLGTIYRSFDRVSAAK